MKRTIVRLSPGAVSMKGRSFIVSWRLARDAGGGDQ
jgi:hypothetical protein